MAERPAEAVDEQGIATLTLNRPEVHAYNGAMIDALVETVGALAADPRVRLLVLRRTAALPGRRRSELAARGRRLRARGQCRILAPHHARHARAQRLPGPRSRSCRAPATAAGSAWSPAATSRSRAHRRALRSQRCDGASSRRRSSRSCARRWACAASAWVTGEAFDAEEARRIGLIHEVCGDDGLDQAAAPVIDASSDRPRGALRIQKLVLAHAGLDLSDQQVEALAVQAAAACRRPPRRRKGSRALRNTRPLMVPGSLFGPARTS